MKKRYSTRKQNSSEEKGRDIDGESEAGIPLVDSSCIGKKLQQIQMLGTVCEQFDGSVCSGEDGVNRDDQRTFSGENINLEPQMKSVEIVLDRMTLIDSDSNGCQTAEVLKPRPKCVPKSASRKGDFICDVCGKRFAEPCKRDRHVNHVHLNLRRFGCHECRKGFSYRGPFIAHFRNTHGLSAEEADERADTLQKSGKLVFFSTMSMKSTVDQLLSKKKEFEQSGDPPARGMEDGGDEAICSSIVDPTEFAPPQVSGAVRLKPAQNSSARINGFSAAKETSSTMPCAEPDPLKVLTKRGRGRPRKVLSMNTTGAITSIPIIKSDDATSRSHKVEDSGYSPRGPVSRAKGVRGRRSEVKSIELKTISVNPSLPQYAKYSSTTQAPGSIGTSRAKKEKVVNKGLGFPKKDGYRSLPPKRKSLSTYSGLMTCAVSDVNSACRGLTKKKIFPIVNLLLPNVNSSDLPSSSTCQSDKYISEINCSVSRTLTNNPIKSEPRSVPPQNTKNLVSKRKTTKDPTLSGSMALVVSKMPRPAKMPSSGEPKRIRRVRNKFHGVVVQNCGGDVVPVTPALQKSIALSDIVSQTIRASYDDREMTYHHQPTGSSYYVAGSGDASIDNSINTIIRDNCYEPLGDSFRLNTESELLNRHCLSYCSNTISCPQLLPPGNVGVGGNGAVPVFYSNTYDPTLHHDSSSSGHLVSRNWAGCSSSVTPSAPLDINYYGQFPRQTFNPPTSFGTVHLEATNSHQAFCELGYYSPRPPVVSYSYHNNMQHEFSQINAGIHQHSNFFHYGSSQRIFSAPAISQNATGNFLPQFHVQHPGVPCVTAPYHYQGPQFPQDLTIPPSYNISDHSSGLVHPAYPNSPSDSLSSISGDGSESPWGAEQVRNCAIVDNSAGVTDSGGNRPTITNCAMNSSSNGFVNSPQGEQSKVHGPSNHLNYGFVDSATTSHATYQSYPVGLTIVPSSSNAAGSNHNAGSVSTSPFFEGRALT